MFCVKNCFEWTCSPQGESVKGSERLCVNSSDELITHGGGLTAIIDVRFAHDGVC